MGQKNWCDSCGKTYDIVGEVTVYNMINTGQHLEQQLCDVCVTEVIELLKARRAEADIAMENKTIIERAQPKTEGA